MSKFLTIDNTTKTTIESHASNGDVYFNTDSNELWVWDTTLSTPDWRKYTSSGLANSFLNEFSTSFNAVYDYLNVTASSATVESISFWFKPQAQVSNGSGSQGLIGISGSSFNFEPGLGGMTGPATLHSDAPILGFSKSTQGTFAVPGVNGMPNSINSTWHHFFAHWTTSLSINNGLAGYEIYFDGARVTGDYSGTPTKFSFNATSKLGVRGNGSKPFLGHMDEIAVWDTDASSEIASIYNSGTGPANLMNLTNKPLHWWRMGDLAGVGDGGTLTTVTDIGTANGTASQADATAQSNTTTASTDTP